MFRRLLGRLATYVNGSLQSLRTGKGQPNVGEPMNESERALAL